MSPRSSVSRYTPPESHSVLTPGLLAALGPDGIEQALRFAGVIADALRQRGRELESAQVMAAYGGGKDSSYLLMFVRAAQQLLQTTHGGKTFKLVVATYTQSGMTPAVFRNISRCFERLGITNDERVLVKTVVDGKAVDFSPERPIPRPTQLRDRAGILVAGHQTQGQARPTFCHRCNFDMVAMMKTVATQLKVDLVVTGDSTREQTQYMVWTDQTARQFGLERPRRDFLGMLGGVESIARRVDEEIHGTAPSPVAADAPDAPPLYLSAFQFTPYEAGKHRAALRYLGFRFDPDTFVGTESDCVNPLLMFHLRGLRAEHVLRIGYEQGAGEYIRLWQELMRAKNIPLDLIDRFLTRFHGADSIAARRAEAGRFAQFAYDLSEEALVAMVFSPFAAQGRNLNAWLTQEVPALLPAENEIREAIAAECETPYTEALTEITALSLRQMHHLWGCELVAPLYKLAGDSEFRRESGGNTPIALLLKRDPHQVEITTRLSADGPEVLEILSGR